MTQFETSRCLMKRTGFMIILLNLFGSLLFAQNMKTYQAEDASFYHAKTEDEHSGYTGDAYVNFDNEAGSYIEFVVFMAESDTQMIYIRYANGADSARPMVVTVNTSEADGMPAFESSGAWTNWVTDSIEVFLAGGENRVRFTSATSDGGPNIDLIDVTGTPGIARYELVISVIGEGRIDVTPPGTAFDEGSELQLTAVPDSGWEFREWQGDTSGISNPLSLTMNSAKSITAVFMTEFDTTFEFEDSPIGFASVDALGQNSTYGGIGGDTTIVETGEELYQILDARRDPHFDQNYPPRVLLIVGVLTWTDEEMMDLKENYDLTLIGDDNYAIIEGFGLNLFRSHNIIIRNIEFRNAPDDCINVTDPLSHHIWIDHCTFSDTPDDDPNGSRHDGLLDIKHGASFVTVSWNHFYNHAKTALLGHSDSNGEEDIGRLKVSYHHNWWENTGSRHPRTRFGEVHVFNNFYDNSEGKMLYGIGVTCYAQVFVEANYFENVATPVLISQVNDDEEVLSGNPEGYIMALDNYTVNSGTIVENLESYAFNPSDYYTYQPDNPAILPSLLMNFSGAGKMSEPITTFANKSPKSRPIDYILNQNYPNPFNPTTSISFQIPKSGWICLNVYDMAGRNVAQLLNEFKVAGEYSLKFDASYLPSGIYIYRLESEQQSLARKMILMK